MGLYAVIFGIDCTAFHPYPYVILNAKTTACAVQYVQLQRYRSWVGRS